VKATNRSCFEGPPSANGLPEFTMLWLVLLKIFFVDIKLKGFQVKRKSRLGHGLPVEWVLRKNLELLKRYWNKISIEEYNEACKKNSDALYRCLE
jgi:isoleucyl-tRNA synthetase